MDNNKSENKIVSRKIEETSENIRKMHEAAYQEAEKNSMLQVNVHLWLKLQKTILNKLINDLIVEKF